MKIIMTGGGTGGHIYPAIAIADEIARRRPEAEIMFVGTEKGLEKSIVPEHGYPIKFVKASGLDRKRLLKNISVLAELRAGIKEAKLIMEEFRPDMIIGTGGYVCGPVALAGRKLGVKIYIHEQNATPGLTNKLLAKHADKIFLGFEEAGTRFKDKGKLIFSGNPVRRSFYDPDRKKARAALGISEDSFMILSFGGSQGAARINEVMTTVAAVISGVDNFVLFLVTGRRYYDKILRDFEDKRIQRGEAMRILPYMDEADVYLAACDVAISRAGAITVSEIAVSGRPAILIPSPNVTGNHQFFNAKALADKGRAELIEEKSLNAEGVINTIIRMKNDGGNRAESAGAGGRAINGTAVDIICENIGI